MITTKSTKQELIEALKRHNVCKEALDYYESIPAETAGKVIEYTFKDKTLPNGWFYWFLVAMYKELDEVYLEATIRRIKSPQLISRCYIEIDDKKIREKLKPYFINELPETIKKLKEKGLL